ncbi:hypothetical protein MAR_017244, partial [Mya arenaria]
VFETLLEPYHDELPEELQKSLGGYMKTLSVDKLSGILEILHEFMLLRIARRENTSDEDYIDNTENRLGEELLAFVELMETPCLDTAVLVDFPQEIHFKIVCVHGLWDIRRFERKWDEGDTEKELYM